MGLRRRRDSILQRTALTATLLLAAIGLAVTPASAGKILDYLNKKLSGTSCKLDNNRAINGKSSAARLLEIIKGKSITYRYLQRKLKTFEGPSPGGWEPVGARIAFADIDVKTVRAIGKSGSCYVIEMSCAPNQPDCVTYSVQRPGGKSYDYQSNQVELYFSDKSALNRFKNNLVALIKKRK